MTKQMSYAFLELPTDYEDVVLKQQGCQRTLL